VLLGGVLTTSLGWRWTLFVNVPIGVACAAAAPPLIAESRAPREGQGFDLPGAATVTAGSAPWSAAWSAPAPLGGRRR
jgi:MFS family permease